nr:MAG TPA: hypothetical protein [Microviridae sp.]
MKNYLKKIKKSIDKIKNISNNIIMKSKIFNRDLEWMRLHGLFTEDQIKMIQNKEAFASNQISIIWEMKNWKLGE